MYWSWLCSFQPPARPSWVVPQLASPRWYSALPASTSACSDAEAPAAHIAYVETRAVDELMLRQSRNHRVP
jgi:hypothetical protein